jgi:DNA-binding GntR family transcriptional regulator
MAAQDWHQGEASGGATDLAELAMPVQRPSLHEEVVGILREMILEGRLPPGSRIAEADLCRRLGVSRTPLREALKVLASDQLVELLPNRGAVVAQVTVAETAELFEVLEGLEAIVGELAASRMSDSAIAELKALHGRLIEHHRDGRRAEYFAANQQIHRRLVEAAGNATLAALHTGYSRKIARARYAANFSQLRWDESVQEHAEIIAALERRDGAALSLLLREHLRRTAQSVLDALRASPAIAARRTA